MKEIINGVANFVIRHLMWLLAIASLLMDNYGMAAGFTIAAFYERLCKIEDAIVAGKPANIENVVLTLNNYGDTDSDKTEVNPIQAKEKP